MFLSFSGRYISKTSSITASMAGMLTQTLQLQKKTIDIFKFDANSLNFRVEKGHKTITNPSAIRIPWY